MALCTVDDIRGLTSQEFVWGRWLLAGLLGLAVFLVARRRAATRPGWRAAAFALMSVPAWGAVLATAPDIVRTFCAQGDLSAVIVPGQTVPATPAYDLSGQYIGAILTNVGYVLAGALALWLANDPAGWRAPTTRRIAHALRGLLPMGQGEARSLRTGIALFPLLVAGNLVLLSLLPKTGDDSHVFERIAPLQVVLLALAAGIGEELVYRGVLQQGVAHLVPGKWPGRITGLAVQAIVFAYAHTGYKDLQHLQFAFYFALVAGITVEWLGLWAAIALHVLIDYAAFAAAAPPSLALQALDTIVATLVLTVAALEILRALRRLRRPTAPA